jgi:quercetin dioxygenase-like cupin family protein
MQVIDNKGRQRATLPGIEHLTVAGKAQSLGRLSVWQQTMQPGCATPPHQHDCEEVVLVLAGSGEVRWEGGTTPFGADSTLVIPPRVAHEIVNTGSAPLVTVAAFSATPVGTFLPDGKPLALPWES